MGRVALYKYSMWTTKKLQADDGFMNFYINMRGL